MPFDLVWTTLTARSGIYFSLSISIPSREVKIHSACLNWVTDIAPQTNAQPFVAAPSSTGVGERVSTGSTTGRKLRIIVVLLEICSCSYRGRIRKALW